MNIAEYLPPGMTVADLMIGTAAAAAALTVLAIWNGLLARDPTAGRIKELTRRQEALMADLKTSRGHAVRNRGLGFMHQVVSRLKLLRNDKTREIADKLARAGWRTRDALVIFLFAKLCLPAVGGGLATLVTHSMSNLQPATRLLAIMGAMGLALFLPDLVTKNAADKRREKIRLGLPDALDLMVICAEAGLSLDSSLKRVSREIALSCPEIADEFGLTSVEIGFLPDRGQALKNLMRRCDLPGVRGLVNTLLQSERYGTPLAHSLRVLSAEYRTERLLKAEEKAARLPAVLTVPMVLFVLPPLFVVLIGPGALRVIDALSGLVLPN